MTDRIYLVSKDGERGLVLEYSNRNRQQVLKEVRDLWESDPVEVPDINEMRRVVRGPGTRPEPRRGETDGTGESDGSDL